MKIQINFLFVLLIVFSLMINSCTNLSKNTYSGLAVMGDVGTTAMKIAITLYKDDLITKDEYGQIRDAYVVYKLAFDAAVEALMVYQYSKTEESEKKLVDSFGKISVASVKISTLLSQYESRRNP